MRTPSHHDSVSADNRPASPEAVSSEGYRFGLGEFECVAISDGVVRYPPQHFFANVPAAQLRGVLRKRNMPVDYVATPLTHLCVEAGEHQVLIDTGAGNLAPDTGKLPQRMLAAGFEPAAIDTVVITHAHPTHVGGLLNECGSPLYLHARCYMWLKEWEFWSSERAFARAPERHVAIARQTLEAIRDQLVFLDRHEEVVPGVGVLSTPGHTPGHIVVSISSRGERLLYIGDVALHPLHLQHSDWRPIYDILPERAADSKRRILDLAAEHKTLVIGQHFPPFPSLGHVTRDGAGWRWHAVEARPGS